jgi:tRNA 5-methylaminomethyl-2-thiouridine biosynthesis bifunctional protein
MKLTSPVVAAELDFDAEGVAYSPRYGDRYHPRSGALAQAEHVFLHGNGLPGRWRGRDAFVVLETGFGLGNNFLATLDAWLRDPRRCERLHFISIEKHPVSRSDLARAHAASPLRDLADALLRVWPPLTANLHRLAFARGRVQLLLALGDVADWLPEIVARVDAFYLDGFAPDRNPAMWQARLFKALARLAAPEATAATWSVARPVRDGLAAAGFEVGRAPGSGGKREITLARFAPRFVPRRAQARSAASATGSERHAIVVGAGLAGCAVAMALAELGWSSTLLECLPAPASATSGNRAGLFHGIVNAADGPHARFNRAAALQAAAAVQVAIDAHGAPGGVDGVLRLEQHAAGLAGMLAQIDALGLPLQYVHALSASAASERAGLALPSPAWYYPSGGWVAPAALAASFMQCAGTLTTLRLGVHVAALRRQGLRWQLFDVGGTLIGESAAVVLANASDALRLIGAPDWPVQRVRGQTTELPVSTPGLRLPRLPVTGNGYVLPPLPGAMALFGATTQPGDAEPRLRWADQHDNLVRLARLTGSVLPAGAATAPSGRVGWRCVAADRLPIIGAVPDRQACETAVRLDQPRFVPRLPGLYVFTALASRGLTWAALGARTLAALVEGAPCPIETSLLDAVDAGRFDSRQARSRASPPVAGSPRSPGRRSAAPDI